MKRLILPQLLLILLITCCDNKPDDNSCPDVSIENPTLTDELDYDIFNAILSNYYSNLNYIHLVQKTEVVSANHIDYIKGKLTNVCLDYDSVSLEDYSEKNKNFYFLSPFLLINNVKLINSEELDCFLSFKNSEWEKYYQKYPDSAGFFKFSLPGINTQEDMAIVEYTWHCGYNVAMGYLVILEKNNGVWIVKNRIDIWAA